MRYIRRGTLTRPEPDYGGTMLDGEPLNRLFVVGLDPSLTAYGLTIMDARNTECWSTWVVKVKSKGTPRLAHIRQHIMTCISGLDIAKVVMEGYSFGSSKSQSHKAGELGGAIKLALHDAMLPAPQTMAPSSLKKFAVGSGAASKSEMLLAVYKRWGVEFDDDNAADAYALARAAYLLHTPDDEIPKFQKAALSKVAAPEG